MSLQGKNVLVTGGGSGIGLAIAEALAREGCKVAISGRTTDTLERAAAGVEALEPLCWTACDVANRAEVKQMFEWFEAKLGMIDILVNCAGTNVAKRMMADLDPADFDQVMGTNLTGTFNCIHAALPGMRRRQGGLIVNIVSVAGKRSMKLAGMPYCVSKFAQGALGTFVSQEAADDGVKVTNIYPGETNTPIVDRRPEPPPAERRAQMLQPEDVADCVLMVAKLPPRAIVPELVITTPYMILD
jgi:NAD(P)-dependent dehydrogenase (short-subunit alcohol dehydrogenase family)